MLTRGSPAPVAATQPLPTAPRRRERGCLVPCQPSSPTPPPIPWHCWRESPGMERWGDGKAEVTCREQEGGGTCTPTPPQPCLLLPASEAGKNPRNGLFLRRQVGALLLSSVVLVLFQFSLRSSAKSLARAPRELWPRGEVALAVVCRESGRVIAVAGCALNLRIHQSSLIKIQSHQLLN